MKKMMGNYSGKLQQLLCLLTCVLMIAAVSIRRDGKVVGELSGEDLTQTKIMSTIAGGESKHE